MISEHVSAMDRPSRSFVPSLNVKKRLTSMAGPWVITVVSFGEPKKKKKKNETVSVGGCTLPFSLSLFLFAVAVSAASARGRACVNGLATIQRKCGPLVSRWRGRRDERVAEVVATAPAEPLLFFLELGSPLDRTTHTRGLITYCFFRAFAALRSSNLCSLSPLATWTWSRWTRDLSPWTNVDDTVPSDLLFVAIDIYV